MHIFAVMELPKKLQQKLDERKANNAFRKLQVKSTVIDFSSNDYLGFSKSELLFRKAHDYLIAEGVKVNGATGSRLISGNSLLYNGLEAKIRELHNTEAALIFNSGYDANVGFFEAVPQRGDIILYDEYIHASIRDGIRLSNAKSYRFKHNNLEDLETLMLRHSKGVLDYNIYVVTESVFSMDGDSPDLKKMGSLCAKNNAFLVVDEAHAIGVFGENGVGLVQELKLEQAIFARIVTYGKGMGCHGSAILGSISLKEYLVNFARSFIYTTGLPPHSLATIGSAYDLLFNIEGKESRKQLMQNIQFFNKQLVVLGLEDKFIESNSAIHCCVISGNDKVKRIANKLQEKGFDVKPILSPTVPKKEERLRICLHSYNTQEEMASLLKQLVNIEV